MPFAEPAQRVTDAVFARNGIPATYEALTGSNPETFADPVDVTLLPTTRDAIVAGFNGTATITDERLFEVRVTEIAEPTKKSRVTVDGIVYRISSDPTRRDKRGLKWTIGCRKDRSA